MTPEEEVRAANPEFVINGDGETIVISPDTDPLQYEAMVTDRVPLRTMEKSMRTEEDAERTRRQKVREALADLDQSADTLLGTGTVTAAMQRQILGRVCRVLAAFIRVSIRQEMNQP